MKNNSMKKEIIKLVQSEEGSVRLNNISTLRRWTNSMGDKVDKLQIDFDCINNVNYSLYDRDIESRDYEGIIKECQEKTELYLQEVSRVLCNNLKAGYNIWMK